MKRILIFALLIFCIFSLCACSEEKEDFSGYVENQEGEAVYILNTNSRKIHYFGCYSASIIKEENRGYYYDWDIDDLCDKGYTTCGNCFG